MKPDLARRTHRLTPDAPRAVGVIPRAVQCSLHEAYSAQSIDAADGDAIAHVGNVFDAVEAEDIGCEGTQPCEDPEVDSDPAWEVLILLSQKVAGNLR